MKRVLFILLALATATIGLRAQELRIQNRPFLDQRFLHYGFFVGVNMMDLELKNNGYLDLESGEQWYSDVDNFQPGFTVGVLGELRLSKYLGLRIQPTIYFGQKHMSMHEQVSGRDTTQNLKSRKQIASPKSSRKPRKLTFQRLSYRSRTTLKNRSRPRRRKRGRRERKLNESYGIF